MSSAYPLYVESEQKAKEESAEVLNLTKDGRKRARVQVSLATKAQMDRSKPKGDGSLYNIYWNSWTTTGYNSRQNEDQIPFTRCDPERDSGVTKGEETMKDAFFCLHFAKGACTRGYTCQFLHRIPTIDDEMRIERSRDCFGRERHRTDRHDMGGVGSFERENRTLYVGKIGAYGDDVENVVKRHFSAFGVVEYIKCLPAKAVAFVKFHSRLSAEFAKDAMNNQSLDNAECINVRWATEDPNPKSGYLFALEAKQAVKEKVMQDPFYKDNPVFSEEMKKIQENVEKVPDGFGMGHDIRKKLLADKKKTEIKSLGELDAYYAQLENADNVPVVSYGLNSGYTDVSKNSTLESAGTHVNKKRKADSLVKKGALKSLAQYGSDSE